MSNEHIPWDKNKIANALELESNLPQDIAEEIAQAVEAKVQRNHVRDMTPAQIRELVNGELLSRGYPHIQRQSLLSIPKFNLKSLLYPDHCHRAARDIPQLFSAIASIVLSQYSMEEVFAQDVVDAHIAGEIHIEGISFPMKIFAVLFYPQIRSIFADGNNPEDFIISLMVETEKILPFVHDSVNIYHLDKYLHPEISLIRSLLVALTHNFYRIAPFCFILENPPGEFASQLITVYREADILNKRGLLPHLAIPIHEESFRKHREAHTAQVCELALDMRKVTFWFKDSYPNWPDPSRICWALDSISLNLVRAACHAKKQLGKFWNEIGRIFGIAVKAHLDKKRFLLSLAEGPLQGLFEDEKLGDKPGCFLEIVGLPESVLYLTGREMSDEEGWEVAVQTLARLQELGQNVAADHGIEMRMVDYLRNNKAEKRFVSLDMEKFPDLKQTFPETVYTKGPHFRLATPMPPKEMIMREGKLHRYLPCAVPLMPEIDQRELLEILRYASQETEAVALRIC